MNRRLSSSLAHGLNPHLRHPCSSPNQFPVSGSDRPCLGPHIHTVTTKTRFASSDVRVRNALLSMRGNCGSGSSESVRHVFESMPHKDLMSWNSIVSSHSWVEDFVSAFGHFSEMRRHVLDIRTDEVMEIFRGLGERNSVSMNGLMVGLVRIGRADEAVEVFRVAKDSVEANCDSYLVLLSTCAVFAVPEAGRRVGREVHGGVIRTRMIDHTVAVENGLINMYAKCDVEAEGQGDIVSWNAMVSAYTHNGLVREAMDLICSMMRDGLKMDPFTLTMLVSTCASIASLERGMEIHAHFIRACARPNVVVESALLDMYSKCGRIDYASRVFERMAWKNNFSWNSMIAGYARHGLCEEALELFEQMRTRGDRQPDLVTFIAILSASERPRLANRAPLVHSSEGRECRVRRRSFGEAIRTRARKRGELRAGLQHARIEGELGRHGTRARADERRARGEEAGRSWVTMRDGVHVFVAGDRSHPEAAGIYAKLGELYAKMREMGYVPRAEFALYDVDAENKEVMLRCHSVRLAVAFVLARAPGVWING
ncbi:putative pentatricopeptide repeat-containing protein [Acorus calamus]|uniref:Pentatricopeptide repeat-containing protein n=1 Tax=Acorus calamus TaxID=4465 RepID=A0AAV9EEZ2_ACOCL|nr:putative pentatricopeptide repeat-containing protein [Acorus calamus]